MQIKIFKALSKTSIKGSELHDNLASNAKLAVISTFKKIPLFLSPGT